MKTKIKVLDYFILKQSEKGIKYLLDVELLEGNKLVKNLKFKDLEGKLYFSIQSIGIINEPIKKIFPLVIEKEESIKIEDLKNKIFVEM